MITGPKSKFATKKIVFLIPSRQKTIFLFKIILSFSSRIISYMFRLMEVKKPDIFLRTRSNLSFTDARISFFMFAAMSIAQPDIFPKTVLSYGIVFFNQFSTMSIMLPDYFFSTDTKISFFMFRVTMTPSPNVFFAFQKIFPEFSPKPIEPQNLSVEKNLSNKQNIFAFRNVTCALNSMLISQQTIALIRPRMFNTTQIRTQDTVVIPKPSTLDRMQIYMSDVAEDRTPDTTPSRSPTSPSCRRQRSRRQTAGLDGLS